MLTRCQDYLSHGILLLVTKFTMPADGFPHAQKMCMRTEDVCLIEGGKLPCLERFGLS